MLTLPKPCAELRVSRRVLLHELLAGLIMAIVTIPGGLAAAPRVLTLGSYIPDMIPVTTIPCDFALHLVAKMFALVGYAWAALLLLRTLSLAHGFTPWRSAGAIALTGVALAAIPLATALLTGYFLARA